MRLLIFSDIHANSLALKYLVDACTQTPHLQVDAYRCLGDVFGYYYDPVGAWNLAYQLDPNLRLGNHDLYTRKALFENQLGVGAAEGENVAFTCIQHAGMLQDTMAKDATLREQLEKHLKPLDAVKPRVESPDDSDLTLRYVHGTPHYRNEIYLRHHAEEYIYSANNTGISDALRSSLGFHEQYENKRKITFIGHTHQPMIASLNAGDSAHYREEIRWSNEVVDYPVLLNNFGNNDSPLLINVGSVGQPRTGNTTRMSYWKINAVHLDTQTRELRFIQLTPPDSLNDEFKKQMRGSKIHFGKDGEVNLKRLREYYHVKHTHVINNGGDPDEWIYRLEINEIEANRRWERLRNELLERIQRGYPIDTARCAYTYNPEYFQYNKL